MEKWKFSQFAILIIVMQFLLSGVSEDVGFEDSGELTASSAFLSISHPTGFPLYMVIGKAVQMVPLGNLTYRMNLLSALFAFISIALLFSMISVMIHWSWATFIALSTLLLTPHFLVQTGVAEIYMMQVAGFSTILYLGFSQKHAAYSIQRLLLAAFIFGLLGALQPINVVIFLPLVVIIFSQSKQGNRYQWGRCIMTVILLFFLGLSIYLYLPLRGRVDLMYHWGPIDTVERFWAHVSAQIYRQNFEEITIPMSWAGFYERLLTAGVTFRHTGFFLLWPFVIIGAWARRYPFFFRLVLVLVMFMDMGYSLFINPMAIRTLQTFHLSLFCAAFLLALGLDEVYSRISNRLNRATIQQ